MNWLLSYINVSTNWSLPADLAVVHILTSMMEGVIEIEVIQEEAKSLERAAMETEIGLHFETDP